MRGSDQRSDNNVSSPGKNLVDDPKKGSVHLCSQRQMHSPESTLRSPKGGERGKA